VEAVRPAHVLSSRKKATEVEAVRLYGRGYPLLMSVSVRRMRAISADDRIAGSTP